MRCYTNDAGGDAMRVVALGTFDGVHLGHQAVLEVAQTIAMCEEMTSCAVTFLNHPLSVVGAGAPPLLTLPGEKALLAAHCGLNELTHGAMRESVKDIVGVQFRNLATVGGSIFGRFGFSDVLTLFMAVGASVEL